MMIGNFEFRISDCRKRQWVTFVHAVVPWHTHQFTAYHLHVACTDLPRRMLAQIRNSKSEIRNPTPRRCSE
jgi:microcystin-dependent protein